MSNPEKYIGECCGNCKFWDRDAIDARHSMLRQMQDENILIPWQTRLILADTGAYCRRHPKFEDKAPAQWCGEWESYENQVH